MKTKAAFVPSPRGEYVELARSRQGKLFRKRILAFGEWAHPNAAGEKLVVDRELAESLVRNFTNGVADIVQVPIVNDANHHTEDPLRNIGEVIDLTIEDDGVWATIDARDEEAAAKLGKTLIGASAMMHLDYTDTRTGKKVGPTLLHVAVTNRPYITDLGDYQEIIAASADTYGDDEVAVFAATRDEDEEIPSMDLEQIKAHLKDEHGIDLDALQAAQAPSTDELVSALSGVLAEAGALKLSGGAPHDDGGDTEVTIQDVAEAVIELSQEKVELASTVQALQAERDEARAREIEAEVDGYISAGRILPKQKDAMIKLASTDRETFEALLPGDAVVALSEHGVATHDEPPSEKMSEEVDRLVELANASIRPSRR